MIEKSIRGLGFDVGRHIFIDWQKRRSYGTLGTVYFLFFFRSVFSSVDGATAGGVLTIYFLLHIMYMGVYVSEVTRKGNSDVRVGERLHRYLYATDTYACKFAQTSFSWHYLA